MELPDISKMRGMSQPLHFAFHVEKVKGHKLLAHAIVFTSYVVMDEESQMKLADPGDDPRFPHLIRFVWQNYLKNHREKLERQLTESKHQIAELDAKIAALQGTIKELENHRTEQQ